MSRFQTWLYRLAAAFVGGGAGAASAGFSAVGIDPDHFNLGQGLGHTLKLCFATFLVSGIMSIFLYLKQHPLPEWDGTNRRGPNGNKGGGG
jgi:hypothetical protein